MARKSDLTRRIQVFIEGSQAQKTLEQMENEVAGLTAELEKLDKADKDYDKRSKELQATINSKNKTIENYKNKIKETKRVLENLSGATYEELLAVHRKLQVELKKTVPGTEAYTRALEQNRRVSELMARVQKDMRTEVGCQATTFGKVAGFLNKYAMLISGAVASLTGLTLTVRKSVNDYAEMEEAMADVKKYTGMADEGVKALNEDLKKMDTRTSRERLNALAADAGRLGITSRDAILEFVDAADKINVALGEDLGEDAVKNIGKLAQMFGESDRLGLRGAMLATGSAINELAQSSSASEAYIVDFTARLAGVGQQANISQADIMGYASALDQNMQQVETSATVMSQLITKMFQQPAKFAALAGMEVKDFADLVAKDANAALLKLLSTMQTKGGFDALAPMFEEMKLNGTRAVGVLSSVASHLDQVRDAQALANKAYNEGNSVIKEFNTKNGTVQAQLEKAKKGFLEVSIALGEKLLPVSSKFISSASVTIRLISNLIDFAKEYTAEIITLATAMAVYNARSKAMAIWDATLAAGRKVLATATAAYTSVSWALNAALAGDTVIIGNFTSSLAKANIITKAVTASTAIMRGVWALLKLDIAAATNAFRIFTAAISVSPFGLFVTLISSLTLGFISLNRKMKEQYDIQSSLDRIQEKSNKEYEKRKDSIEELKKLMPEYASRLEQEGALYAGNTEALMRYNAALQAHTRYTATKEEYDKALELLQNLEKFSNVEQTGPAAFFIDNQTEENLENARAKVDALRKSMNQYWFEYKKASGGQGNTWTSGEIVPTTTYLPTLTDPTNNDDKARKERLEKLKNEYTQLQAEIKKIYAEGKDAELQTEEQYNARMLEAKKDYLEQVKIAAGEGSKEFADAENLLADIQLQERKDALQKAIDEENEIYENQKRQLQEDYINRSDERIDSQESYNELLEQLELMHLQRMLEIDGLDADSRMKIEQQVRDFQMKCVNEFLAAKKKADEKEVQDAEEKKKKLEAIAERQRQTLEGYAKSFGDAVGRVISSQEDALRAFSDTMIDLVFDVLEKIIEAKIAEATATAVAAEGKATAESFATADSVLTFGASGAARAAVMSALIMGALAVAKATLKGLIGKKGSSSSSAGETQSSPKVYQRVAQHASGRYQVIGEQDGRRYDAPYIGPSPTGIVRSPALIAENGSELIVNAEDLQRLQKHMNWPLVLQAIADSRRPQPVAQHASGSYPQDTARPVPSPAGADPVMRRLADVLEDMVRNGVKAPVVLSEIEKKRELLERSRRLASK